MSLPETEGVDLAWRSRIFWVNRNPRAPVAANVGPLCELHRARLLSWVAAQKFEAALFFKLQIASEHLHYFRRCLHEGSLRICRTGLCDVRKFNSSGLQRSGTWMPQVQSKEDEAEAASSKFRYENHFLLSSWWLWCSKIKTNEHFIIRISGVLNNWSWF